MSTLPSQYNRQGMPLYTVFYLLYYTASNFYPCISGWLRCKIIRAAMYNDRFADNLFDGESTRENRSHCDSVC